MNQPDTSKTRNSRKASFAKIGAAGFVALCVLGKTHDYGIAVIAGAAIYTAITLILSDPTEP